MASNPGDIGTSSKEDVVPQAAPATETMAARVEDEADVPDPDEDDLDDLDELLDEFSPLKVADSTAKAAVPSKPPAATTTSATSGLGSGEPPKEPTFDDVLNEEDFAKQLQAGMAELLGEIESSPEMHAQFESIFKELSAAASESANEAAAAAAAAADGTSSSSSPQPPPPPSPGVSGEASFQETIRRTMERMQSSGEQATAAAAAEGTDDFMAELLKQMGSGGMGLDGEGNEEEFSKMLLGMMEQLTNKEILYEPMRELHDKFPGWLEKNKDKTPAEDLKRYEEQQRLVKEIVVKFEEASYSDTNPKDREYIVERMQKMQSAGSPPPDLVGDMPSAQDALNMPDEGCNPQ